MTVASALLALAVLFGSALISAVVGFLLQPVAPVSPADRAAMPWSTKARRFADGGTAARGVAEGAAERCGNEDLRNCHSGFAKAAADRSPELPGEKRTALAGCTPRRPPHARRSRLGEGGEFGPLSGIAIAASFAGILILIGAVFASAPVCTGEAPHGLRVGWTLVGGCR